MTDEIRDAELVRRHLAGDRLAFETLYRRHAPAVWRFAVYAAGGPDGAEEALQETFLRAARGLKEFRGEKAELRTWLVAIARNVLADLGGRKRADAAALTALAPEALARAAAGDGADPEQTAETRELIGELRRAVASLPEAERTCLVLCELQGFAVKAAAAATGWSESKVKVSVFRARRRLRERLERRL